MVERRIPVPKVGCSIHSLLNKSFDYIIVHHFNVTILMLVVYYCNRIDDLGFVDMFSLFE